MSLPIEAQPLNVADTLEALYLKVHEIGVEDREISQHAQNENISLDRELEAARQEALEKYKQEIKHANEVRDRALSSTAAIIKGLDAQLDECGFRIEKMIREWDKESFFKRHSKKRIAEHDAMVHAVLAEMQKLKRTRSLEEQNLQLIRGRHVEKCEEAKKSEESLLTTINANGRKKRDVIEDRAKHRRSELATASAQFMRDMLPDSLIDALNQELGSTRIQYENYEAPEIDAYSRPGLFYLGTFQTTAAQEDTLGTEIAKKALTHGGVANGHGFSLHFKIPAIFDLAHGLRLVMTSTKREDRKVVDQCMRNLVLRLLLTYPPEKLRVAMVDPLRNAQTFTGIPRLVDHAHESIIYGNVRVKDSDIEDLMSTLCSSQQTFNEGYGPGDAEKFFEREAVQAVFINDFPAGFTSSALSNLAKVMEGGATYGMIFVISVNSEHAKGMKANSDYRSIMSDPNAWYIEMPSGMCKERKNILLCIDDEHESIYKAGDALMSRLREEIANAKGRTISFGALHPSKDMSNLNSLRRKSSLNGLELAIGISGTQGPAPVTLGRPDMDIRHHGLVAGLTGAGKTNLLRTLVMSSLVDYSADNAQLVLIDFKEGVEFREFAGYGIPALRSITVSTQPEFALAALQDVEAEFKIRMEKGVSNYKTYREENPSEFMPRIVVVFDEVQNLFASGVQNELRAECARILKLLVEEGRAAGIHVILASQSFARITEVDAIMHNMAIRIVVKDAGDGGILSDASALESASKGYAILNDHRGENEAYNQLIHVPLLTKKDCRDLLERLSEAYRSKFTPELKYTYGGAFLQTRLLFENVEDDPEHPFSRIARFAKLSEGVQIPTLEKWHGEHPLLIIGSILSFPGTEYQYARAGSRLELELSANMLLVGKDSTIATKMFISTVLSTCLDNLCRTRGDDDVPVSNRVIVMNFGESSRLATTRTQDQPTMDDRKVGLESIYEFAHVERVSTRPGERRGRFGTPTKSQVEQTIEELCALLEDRKAQVNLDPTATFDSVIVLMYGFDNAAVFTSSGIHELGIGNTPIERLRILLLEGVAYNINFVVWSRSLASVNHILGYGDGGLTALSAFNQRIAFSCPKEDLLTLMNLDELPATSQGAAFYDSLELDRLYLCPYSLPQTKWFLDFCDGYENLLEAIGRHFDDTASLEDWGI